MVFFISYLAAPRPSFGRWQRDNLSDQMLINANQLKLTVTGNLVTRLGSKAQLRVSVGFKPETFRFWVASCLRKYNTIYTNNASVKHFYNKRLPALIS